MWTQARIGLVTIGDRDPIRRLHDPDFHSTLLLRVLGNPPKFLEIFLVLPSKRHRHRLHVGPDKNQIPAFRPDDVNKTLPVILCPGAKTVRMVELPSSVHVETTHCS